MKKKIIIPVVVIIILLVIGLVYMNQSQESSLTPTPTETPVPTETPTPNNFNETKISTPESASYQFDVHVENYKYANDITDEDLRNNQDTRYAMYEDIYLSGYDHVDAAKEQEEGCNHEFIEEFRQYSLDRNLEKIPDPNDTEPPADTSGKYEVSPGVYNDGTTRELTSEEWESMTKEEQDAWEWAAIKELGGGDVTDISEEATQEAFDDLTDPNNPYIQEILEYKASLNN